MASPLPEVYRRRVQARRRQEAGSRARQAYGARLAATAPNRELLAQAEDIPYLEWRDFEPMLAAELEGGEHVSIFASTGDGKTHLIRWGLLPFYRRDPVLILDVKRDRGTLRGCGTRVQRFPSWLQLQKYRNRRLDSEAWERDPEVWRLCPPLYRWSGRGASREREQARLVVGQSIDRVLHEGGWVLVADDATLITDPRPPGLDLGAPMRAAWKMGRDRPLTVIAATQQPAGVPTEMYDQATHIFLGGTDDERRHERLAEIGGNRRLLQLVVATLNEKEFLYVHGRRRQGQRAMAVVVAPPART